MTSETAASTTALLPCPFCGGQARMALYVNHVPPVPANVMCGSCFASTGQYPTDEEACAAWNRRSLVAPITEAERHDRMTFAAVFRKAREVIIYPDEPTTATGSSISLPAEARARLLALLVDGEPELAAAARAFREAFAGGQDAHTTEQWAALERLDKALEHAPRGG